MVQYYSKFLPNLATILHPLNELLRINVKWQWNSSCKSAFQKIKDLIVSAGVLTHYQPELPLVLATDASPYGIGAVISHVIDNTEKPIAFASRTLTKAERNYSQLDREALGIVYGVKKFHQYLYGRKWTLVTDHKPLTSIFHPHKAIPAMAAARLQRWALLLGGYDYDIEFRRSKENAIADCMSRLPLDICIKDVSDPVHKFTTTYLDNLPVTHEQIQKFTRNDAVLSKVYHMIMNGWSYDKDPSMIPFFTRRNELSAWNGCVMRGVRVVIPSKLKERILQELHVGHLGIVKMKGVARSFVWWPGIDKEIELLANQCKDCQNHAHMPPRAPVHPWMYPSRPWERVHVDFAGPFQGHMFFVVVDAYSKWLEVVVMSSTSAQATIDVLRDIFSRTGLPDQLHSDNGPQFIAEEFRVFMAMNGIVHTTSPVHHPSSNGLAERYVQTVKQALRASGEKISVKQRLAQFLLSYRNAPNATTHVSPAQIFLGRSLKTRLDLVKPNVRSTVARQQDKMTGKGIARQFSVGDEVFTRNYGKGDKWLQGTVVEKLGPLTCSVQVQDKNLHRHADQLRRAPAISQQTPGESMVIEPTTTDIVTPVLAQPTSVDNSKSPPKPVVSAVPAITSAATSVVTSSVTPVRRYPAREHNRPRHLESYDCTASTKHLEVFV